MPPRVSSALAEDAGPYVGAIGRRSPINSHKSLVHNYLGPRRSLRTGVLPGRRLSPELTRPLARDNRQDPLETTIGFFTREVLTFIGSWGKIRKMARRGGLDKNFGFRIFVLDMAW